MANMTVSKRTDEYEFQELVIEGMTFHQLHPYHVCSTILMADFTFCGPDTCDCRYPCGDYSITVKDRLKELFNRNIACGSSNQKLYGVEDYAFLVGQTTEHQSIEKIFEEFGFQATKVVKCAKTGSKTKFWMIEIPRLAAALGVEDYQGSSLVE